MIDYQLVRRFLARFLRAFFRPGRPSPGQWVRFGTIDFVSLCNTIVLETVGSEPSVFLVGSEPLVF